MNANRITLIGTSQGGRPYEVDRLLKSLIGTTEFLEVIFVDQSDNDEILNITLQYQDKVSITLLKRGKMSLSKARNIAIAYSSGNIISFCDDDAFYDMATLKYLRQYILEKKTEILSSKVIDNTTNSNYAGEHSLVKKPYIIALIF